MRRTEYDVAEIPPIGAGAKLVDLERVVQAHEISHYPNQFIFILVLEFHFS